MKRDLKLFFSFVLGIGGLILLICNLIVEMFLPVATPSNLGEILSKRIRYTLGTPSEVLFILVFPLSLIGLFLGIKALKRKIAILAIILNALNLLFSLFIAWLLFGLARGL